MLGTSSSESVLPRMLAKMENLGADKSVVGLVIPTGYSFNLDGTCIYLTMAAVFLAQATNTDLTWGQQLALIGILLLTSKGAAGVTGSGFIVLAATLASLGTVPVASIALILGVDRFMSEARALTNLVGNGVATIVVAKWEGALDEARMRAHLDRETDQEADDPETVLVAEDRSRRSASRGRARPWSGLRNRGRRLPPLAGEGSKGKNGMGRLHRHARPQRRHRHSPRRRRSRPPRIENTKREQGHE